MSLRPRCMTPWRCLWTVVLMAIHGASESRWQQLQPTGTAPTPRSWHTAVWRAGTGGMLIFGGYDYSSGRRRGKRYNDLHLFLDEEKQWQLLSPTGTAPPPRSSHTTVWRTGTGGMLVFGGMDESFRHLNDLHLYVDEESRWQLLQPSGTAPTPRDRHSAVWRAGTGGMLVFGGWDESFRRFNDLHLYVDEENRWQQLQPTGTAPTPRYAHTAVWRAGTGGMLVFGGWGSGFSRLNDLHLYVDEENRWQQLQPSGTAPTPRSSHSAVWRAETGGMLVFGGYGGSWSGYLNDLYLYLDQEKRWQQLQPTGAAPTPRDDHTAVWRAGTGGMLVFGGYGRYGRLNDLHLYVDEAADPSTSPRTSTTAPTSASSVAEARFEVDPVDQKLEDTPAEDDTSAGLYVAVASVLTCLLVILGILCWHRARKHPGPVTHELSRQVPAPELAGCPDPEQADGVLPSSCRASRNTGELDLPSLTIPPLTQTAPVVFSWNSRMTAEWPRGKVQSLVVGEASFETHRRHFSFHFQQPGQCRRFLWQDGTVQRLDHIHKNVVWWSTQHEHPAWQQFRWVCTPQCRVEGVLHDMKLVESERPRCAICSSTGSSEKHWYCEQHQVHVCPACAELPPDPPTLGISASYLLDIFPPLARSSTAMADPNFYEICPHLAHGLSGIGYDKMCPRDGKLHCSMVDALEDKYSGKVTHFVSWCWAYRLEDVITAVAKWLEKSSETPENVFLWMCFFCNNQYRIMDQAVATGSEDLKDIFEGHLVAAGQMLVLLDKITQPTYVTRAWCIFETYVSIARDIPMTMILPSGAEDFFRETVLSGGFSILSSAVRDLDVSSARAGSKKDEDLIKSIIHNTIGFETVNDAVRARLVKELTALFGELLMSQPK